MCKMNNMCDMKSENKSLEFDVQLGFGVFGLELFKLWARDKFWGGIIMDSYQNYLHNIIHNVCIGVALLDW